MLEMIQNRVKWIDYVRALAIGMVVLTHVTEYVYQFSADSLLDMGLVRAVTGLALFSLGRIGVPLFMMISGYLLLNRTYDESACFRFWRKNVLRLFICTECWFLIYDVYLVLTGVESFSAFNILEDLLFLRQVNMGFTWYLPMLLGMYILFPFVANALHSMKASMLIFPILVYIGYSFVTVYLNRVSQLLFSVHLTNMPFSLGFSGGYFGIYFILGYTKDFLKRISSCVLSIISIFCFICMVVEQYAAALEGYDMYVWYDELFLLICSACLFELLSRVQRFKYYKVIISVSRISFAIYLLHVVVLRTIGEYVIQTASKDGLTVICLWVLVFILTCAVTYIIQLIPRFGKYILYIK